MGGSSSGSSSSSSSGFSGGGWGDSPHGNPHGVSGATADSHGGYSGGFSGQTGVANAADSMGMIGGLLANDQAVSAGFAPGTVGRESSDGSSSGGGGNTVMPQGQFYGLGISPDYFWDEYEKRYGVPVTQSQQIEEAQAQIEEAQAQAAASQQQFHNLTNDLLMQFEENWRNIFGGRGDLFPEVAPHRDVTQTYQDVLQRRPDLEGLEYWTDKHQRKGGLSQILPQFKAAAQDEIEGRK